MSYTSSISDDRGEILRILKFLSEHREDTKLRDSIISQLNLSNSREGKYQ